jgi:hypothetical protein
MSKTSSRKNKGFLLAGALGIVAVGGVLASAASIGTVSSSSLGSGVQVVASCDTNGVNVAYTNTYNTISGKYEVTAVTVSGIDAACATKTLDITLADSPSVTAVSRGTGSVTVGASGTETFAIVGNTDAGLVGNAAIVIAG